MKTNDITRLIFICVILAFSIMIAFFQDQLPFFQSQTTIIDQAGTPKTVKGPAFPYRLGLDLRGGVHVVLEAEATATNPLTDTALDRTIAVLENRVNKLGVSETVIQRQGSTGRIVIDMPGYQNKDEALSVLGKTALLQFKDAKGNLILTGDKVKKAEAVFAPTSQGIGQEWQISFELDAEGTTKFKDATQKALNEAKEEDRTISIWLDDKMLMSPRVQSVIESGTGVITSGGGDISQQRAWATTNALLIEGGALPLKMKSDPAELRYVGASLGADTINRMQVAAFIALALIALYMLLYYKGMGAVSVVSLAIYSAIYLALLLMVGAVFSLPAIGGAIISIGMAVDANVIIFERIRDELRDGKTPTSAIANGFSKAFSTVFDSNLTTLIGCGVLYWLGTGPVKGFAVTLTFGIITSFFTALFVTRFFMDMIVRFWKPEPDSALFNFFYGVGGGK